MNALPMDRAEFFKQLAGLWRGRRSPSQLSRVDYLRGLAVRAAGLKPAALPENPDLDLFRSLVMARPDDMRRRLLGANVLRLRGLAWSQRNALRTLETWPDLLSPLAELRYEPSHSRIISYHMCRQPSSPLANELLRAFLLLADCPPETLEADALDDALVTPEAWLPTEDRLDIRIETERLLVFVEVKVDASEGRAQLPRYRAVLDHQCGGRASKLIYLTLPGAEGPSPTLDCTHLTFEDLLAAWLPWAHVDGETAGYLARYLKSVALLVGRAGFEGFEKWTFAEQRSALDFVDSIEARDLA